MIIEADMQPWLQKTTLEDKLMGNILNICKSAMLIVYDVNTDP